MENLLDKFDAQSILVLGDVFIDEYLSGDCSRLSPEAPVPVLRVEPKQTRRVLGGAANTAANVASLGGKAVLIGLVGSDTHGKEFRELCEGRGIEFLGVGDGRPTSKKIRLLGQRQQLLRMDYEETAYIAAPTEQSVLAHFRTWLSKAAMVVLSDYAKGFFTRAMVQAIIREAHAQKKEVLIDPRPQHGPWYVGCDYLTPNWKETQGLLGQEDGAPGDDLVRKNGEALRDLIKANVLITLGSKGISCFDREGKGSFTLPTQAREVFDVSGAGDTVVAAFALALAAGGGLEASVALANRAAGVVVGKLGTATVTREEILDADYREKRLIPRGRLAPLAAELKAEGKTVVTLNGSFDLMHAGHVHIIEEAKRQGDVLIVGLNSDASVRGYKGAGRPIVPEGERARMLLALRAVDYVHIFDEAVPMPFLEEVKPHVHANGSEYGPDCVEAPTVKAHGGRLHVVEKIPGLSTSDLLARIKAG